MRLHPVRPRFSTKAVVCEKGYEKEESCAARSWEEGRHAASKIKRAVGMKIAVEDSKRCNTAAVKKRLKTILCCRDIFLPQKSHLRHCRRTHLTLNTIAITSARERILFSCLGQHGKSPMYIRIQYKA
ncbi:hypothetical protein E2C01_040310 [Portunus trituberculatus]|uniref:Uncharacterized protein n=1 Tax=Portunus trituberculatus TaxID=210409 RepID=A0A5B7FNV4_PORTR|nr:hypothetical protein [Portunus trituberculatus]